MLPPYAPPSLSIESLHEAHRKVFKKFSEMALLNDFRLVRFQLIPICIFKCMSHQLIPA